MRLIARRIATRASDVKFDPETEKVPTGTLTITEDGDNAVMVGPFPPPPPDDPEPPQPERLSVDRAITTEVKK